MILRRILWTANDSGSKMIVVKPLPNLQSRFFSSQSDDSNTSVNIHEHKLKRPTPKLSSAQKSRLKEDTKGSLISDTLKEMDNDVDLVRMKAELDKFGRSKLTKEERLRRQRSLTDLGIPSFQDFLRVNAISETDKDKLIRRSTEILQLNIGLYCNQACSHCHVESSPKRTEMMPKAVIDKVAELLDTSSSIHTVDITGGAPELCSEFRYCVERLRELDEDLTIIDRCNLTSLLEPGYEDIPDFLADHRVQVVASLPCYSPKNVNLQRGKGVFQRSIRGLLELNDRGYGRPGTGRVLNLVYNPLGAFLPPDQEKLEEKYRTELWSEFGIEFNNLYVMTNMPIKRFADFLYRRGELHEYMELLVRNFNAATLDSLMCRNVMSVNYDGKIFDCDFNQQLDLEIKGPKGQALSVFDLESLDQLEAIDIQTDNHCFGCTAGRGSS